MKYRANVSFAGKVGMYKGEERELPDSLAEPLVNCGYLSEVKRKESKRNNKRRNSKPSP